MMSMKSLTLVMIFAVLIAIDKWRLIQRATVNCLLTEIVDTSPSLDCRLTRDTMDLSTACRQQAVDLQ